MGNWACSGLWVWAQTFWGKNNSKNQTILLEFSISLRTLFRNDSLVRDRLVGGRSWKIEIEFYF